MRVIGVTGFIGSGKGEVAQVLVSKYGFTKEKFALPLKFMLRNLFILGGASDDQVYEMLEGSLKEEPTPILCGVSPRRAMQTLGTEWGRLLIHPNIWAMLLLHRVRQLRADADVVIDDVRFPNEVSIIREELGGVIWRVIRTGIYSQPHVSESEQLLLDYDTPILNNGSLQDLEHTVSHTLTLIRR